MQTGFLFPYYQASLGCRLPRSLDEDRSSGFARQIAFPGRFACIFDFGESATILIGAQIFHRRGVARGGAGGVPLGVACRPGSLAELRESRTMAATAGLRSGRPHEDRAGYGPYPFRGTSR